MSVIKDDVLLEERIQRIRKQNEQIQKRHLEVEADKQFAAKTNSLVSTTVPAEDWTAEQRGRYAKSRKENSHEEDDESNHKEYHDRNMRNRRKENGYSAQERRGDRSLYNTHSVDENVNKNGSNSTEPDQLEETPRSGRVGKVYTFKEGDGPPPDPAYNFLADSSRDPERPDRAPPPPMSQRGGRRIEGRKRPPRNERNEPALNNKREDRVSQQRYDTWKEERRKIDEERIQRQKTSDGRWRREWDNEKRAEEEEVSTRVNRQYYHRGTDQDEQGKHFVSPKSPNMSRNRDSPRRRSDTHRRSEDSSPDRSVTVKGYSFKISFKNDLAPASPEPVQRVKVTAPHIAGTGRVGPRQKPQVSYSKQPRESSWDKQSKNSNISNAAQSTTSDVSSEKPPLGPERKPGSWKGKYKDGSLNKDTAPKYKKKFNWRTERDVTTNKAVENGKSTNQSESDGGNESWEDVTSGTDSTGEFIEDQNVSKDKTPENNSTDVASGVINNVTHGNIALKSSQDECWSDCDESGVELSPEKNLE